MPAPSGDLRSSQSAVLPIGQRFGSALNLNVHFHMLFLDGVYRTTDAGLSFRRVKAPAPAELARLVHTLSERIARHLERRGLLVRDEENDFLTVDASDDSTLDELRSHSITYRIALGPHAGRKAFTLQTLTSAGEFEHDAARVNGFSLHAGVVAAAAERDKLERLCRYITRPAVSTERLSLTAQGGEPSDKVQRLEHHVGGAIPVRRLQSVMDEALGCQRQALSAHRWPCDVTA